MTTPETYLIPATLEKNFRIIYGEKCGIEPKYENGRRILEVPANGILIIKSKLEPGWINHEYFFVDTKGNKIKVGGENFTQNKNSLLPRVSLSGTGVMSGTSLNESPDIRYSDFRVYNKDTTDSNDFKYSERFDSLTRALVANCRTYYR